MSVWLIEFKASSGNWFPLGTAYLNTDQAYRAWKRKRKLTPDYEWRVSEYRREL